MLAVERNMDNGSSTCFCANCVDGQFEVKEQGCINSCCVPHGRNCHRDACDKELSVSANRSGTMRYVLLSRAIRIGSDTPTRAGRRSTGESAYRQSQKVVGHETRQKSTVSWHERLNSRATGCLNSLKPVWRITSDFTRSLSGLI